MQNAATTPFTLKLPHLSGFGGLALAGAQWCACISAYVWEITADYLH